MACEINTSGAASGIRAELFMKLENTGTMFKLEKFSFFRSKLSSPGSYRDKVSAFFIPTIVFPIF